MTATSWPSSRDRSPALVITALGAASASMNPIRAAGSPGSIGRYAAPALSTASIATIASAQRSNSSATDCPGPAPYAISRCASRLDGLLKLAIRPGDLTADQRHRLGGARCLRGEHRRNRYRAGAGAANTARLPQPSSRACSSASSRSSDDNRRAGSAVIASTTRRHRWISTSMLAASNTSVRNSTTPPMPAGSPATTPAFGQRKTTNPFGRCGSQRPTG